MTITTHDWHTIPGLSQRLIELHALTGARSMTMRDIAEKLNAEYHTELTRNAIIGRCRRIGLATRLRCATPGAAGPRPAKLPPGAPIAPIETRHPRNTVSGEAKRRRNESLSLVQLREGDCHWPLGRVEDYPPFQYCGKPAVFGRPYCPVHHKRAHNIAGSRP